jgi:guanylate kinase
MLVLSSPSGAGKSTLSRHLLATDPDIDMSVSVTTRKPRPGERDGKEYHFISQEQFDQMVEDDELLEFATVFGNSYGTPRGAVEKALGAGRDILFDIDWQGTQQLMDKAGKDLVRVFILPPSAKELAARLHRRAEDSEEVIAGRMAEAASEISHWAEYDYVFINDDLEASHKAIADILAAERLRRSRQVGLAKFVRQLQADL